MKPMQQLIAEADAVLSDVDASMAIFDRMCEARLQQALADAAAACPDCTPAETPLRNDDPRTVSVPEGHTGIVMGRAGWKFVYFQGKLMARVVDLDSAELTLAAAYAAAQAGMPGKLLATDEELDGCTYCGVAPATVDVWDSGETLRACEACAVKLPVAVPRWCPGCGDALGPIHGVYCPNCTPQPTPDARPVTPSAPPLAEAARPADDPLPAIARLWGRLERGEIDGDRYVELLREGGWL